jgi:hypothetical protein
MVVRTFTKPSSGGILRAGMQKRKTGRPADAIGSAGRRASLYRMWRCLAFPLLLLALPAMAAAQTCRLAFTVEVTQGVGPIQPGARLEGEARYTTLGRSIRQEGGSTAHLATGDMRIGPGIRGSIWTLITTSRGEAADLVGVYARDVSGLSFAGLDYDGPMMLTLFGPAGSRPEAGPPRTQAEWDRMDLRRSFSLHAHGADMLAGDVTALVATCDAPGAIDSGGESTYPAAQ